MKYKSYSKGFTLIELLVVIAIIAILSGTILVSLNSARSKAKDARVQAEMQQLKSQMELYYSSSGNYGATPTTSCTTGTTPFTNTTTDGANKLTTAITADANSGIVYCGTAGTPANAWAVAAKLNSGSFWCVDSTGASRNIGTTLSAAVTVCP